MASTAKMHPTTVKSWILEDAHLTLEDKQSFWNYHFNGALHGVQYTGSTLALAAYPQLAKNIHRQYDLFCQSRLNVRTQKEQLAKLGVSNPIGTNDSLGLQAGASGIYPQKKAPAAFQMNIASPICANVAKTPCTVANSFCSCGAPLTATDNIYCEECWAYFAVSCKVVEYRAEHRLPVPPIIRWTEDIGATVAATQAPKPAGSTFRPTTRPVHVNALHGQGQPADVLARSDYAIYGVPNSSPPDINVNATQIKLPVQVQSTKQTSPYYPPLVPKARQTPILSSNRKSLPTPPPSSSPTVAAIIPQHQVIDLTDDADTSAPATAQSSQAATSSKPKPQNQTKCHKSCVKCHREFPVNLKNNGGVWCTQCCRKEQRKVLEVKVSAVESLPSPLRPVAASATKASPKRKAENAPNANGSNTMDGETLPATKKTKMDSGVVAPMQLVKNHDPTMFWVDETIEGAVAPADMSFGETSYYGWPDNLSLP